MAKKRKWLIRLACFSASIHCVTAKAQLSLSAQFRPRAEYRNGFATLPSKTADPAFFISQRSRLALQYKSSRILFRYALQDVRIWGQDASTISNADGAKLSTHEAWAELVLSNKKDSVFKKSPVDLFNIRVGRQELVYDDQRLLGNLDWLQQARRHDAIVFKLLENGWQTDIGLAFNQHTDAFNYNGTYYTPANVVPYVKDNRGNLTVTPAGLVPLTNSAGWSAKSGNPALLAMPSTNGLNQAYKSMQFIYASRSIRNMKFSALLFADHFGKYRDDSVRNISGTDTGYIYGRRFNQPGVHSRLTGGLQVIAPLNAEKSLQLTAGAWYQGGKDRDGQSLAAYMSTISFSYNIGRWTYTTGWDYLSGNNALSPGSTNHRFDPLYGTPHKFWGQMDYFYAGTGSPAGGLNNPYAKVRFASKDKRFSTGLDYHFFSLAGNQLNEQGTPVDKYLGSEIDLQAQYAFSHWASLETGAGLMAASSSMAYAKGLQPDAVRKTGTWAYLMLHIKPEYLFK